MRTSLISIGAAALLMLGAPLAHAWCDYPPLGASTFEQNAYAQCEAAEQQARAMQEQTEMMREAQMDREMQQMRDEASHPLPNYDTAPTPYQPPVPPYAPSAPAYTAPTAPQPTGPTLVDVFVMQAQGQNVACSPNGAYQTVLPGNNGIMVCVNGAVRLGFTPGADPNVVEGVSAVTRKLAVLRYHGDTPTVLATCDIGFTAADHTGIRWELRGENAVQCGFLLQKLRGGAPQDRVVSESFTVSTAPQ